jgi:hypothetical protein
MHITLANDQRRLSTVVTCKCLLRLLVSTQRLIASNASALYTLHGISVMSTSVSLLLDTVLGEVLRRTLLSLRTVWND